MVEQVEEVSDRVICFRGTRVAAHRRRKDEKGKKGKRVYVSPLGFVLGIFLHFPSEQPPMSLHTYEDKGPSGEYLQQLISFCQDPDDKTYTQLQATRSAFLQKHVSYRTHAGVDYYDVNSLLSIHFSSTPKESTEEDTTSSPLQYLVEQAANIDQVHRLQRNWEFGPSVDELSAANTQFYPFTTLDDFDRDALPFIEGFPASQVRIAQIIMQEFERLDCVPYPPDDQTKYDLGPLDSNNCTKMGRLYDFFRCNDDAYNRWYFEQGNFTYEAFSASGWYSALTLVKIFTGMEPEQHAVHFYEQLLAIKNKEMASRAGKDVISFSLLFCVPQLIS